MARGSPRSPCLAGDCAFHPGNDLSARLESAALAEPPRQSAPKAGRQTTGSMSSTAAYGSTARWKRRRRPASFILATPCAISGSRPRAGRRYLGVAPRFVVVADRRIHYVCEQADRWRAIDDALAASYRRVAHSAGAVNSFDVFEAVAPGLRSGAAGPDRARLAAAGDG